VLHAEVPALEAGPLGERVEQLHPLAHELDLLRVVELESEGPGRRRRRERAQCGSTLEHDHAEAGTRSEESRRAADHAATDHHDIGRGGRLVREPDARTGRHKGGV
jgi:hypothetical protein